ncbi:transposase, partial [Frigidibacter sp. MR17.14]|uniref:transposase n=1 Tax=Frigidibacter sp. MR17.14 TaxID=3126509 RepID=UPI0030131DDE
MAKPPSPRYRTTNWSDYNAALRHRGSLSIWFDPRMAWHAAWTGKRGHPDTFSEAAI